jgi:hypothetical protein
LTAKEENKMRRCQRCILSSASEDLPTILMTGAFLPIVYPLDYETCPFGPTDVYTGCFEDCPSE